MKTFRVSRIRGDIRLATRRERDFRLPERFDADEYRLGPPWQVGKIVGEARIEVGGDTAWWVDRLYGRYGRIEDGVFITDYSNLGQLSTWILRQDGRAVPLAPPELRRLVRDDLDLVQKRHNGKLPQGCRRDGAGGNRGGGAAREPGAAGALRTAPGPPRLPARPLRRGHAGRHPGRRHRRALPHPTRIARGAPPAPEPRQFRRRLLRRLHGAPGRPGARREGARRRHVPLAAAG